MFPFLVYNFTSLSWLVQLESHPRLLFHQKGTEGSGGPGVCSPVSCSGWVPGAQLPTPVHLPCRGKPPKIHPNVRASRRGLLTQTRWASKAKRTLKYPQGPVAPCGTCLPLWWIAGPRSTGHCYLLREAPVPLSWGPLDAAHCPQQSVCRSVYSVFHRVKQW